MLNKKIAYNSIISSGARIIGLALSLVIIGFITRYLGKDGFGYYSVILAFLYFFTVLADLGLYSICLREISRPNADENKIINNAFTLRFFAGLIVFSFAPIVVLFFPYTNEVKLGVLIGSLGFWMMSNHQVLMGVFQKHLKMDRVAIAELSGRLFQLILILFFIWQKLGFLFVVSSFVLGALINFIIVLIFVKKYVHISFEFDFVFWRSLLKESLPLALAIIFTVIYFKLDTIMLSLMKPPGDVGIYNLSYKFLESLLFFPAMFIGLVMPLMSEYALSFKEKFNKITQESLDILLLFTIPLIIGTFFLSKKIVILIAGEDFLLSAGVLNMLIIAGGIIFLGVLFSNMIISLKEQKKLTYIYGIGAIINLITNFIFIPKYSYYGAAGTTILTEFIVTGLMLIVLYKTLNSLPSFRSIFKYIIAGLIMALPLYYLPDFSLFPMIIISSLIYFGFLRLINGMPFGLIKNLIRK